MTHLFNTSKPKARKEHTCIWCGEIIKKGEIYIRTNHVDNGDFYSNAWHAECENQYLIENKRELFEYFTPGDNPRPKTTSKKTTTN